MRKALAAALLLLACRAHAHEGWGIVVHDRLGVVVSDIPGNTIWRIADGRAEPLLRDVHSHALVAIDDALYGTDAKTDGSAYRVWRFDGRFSEVARDVPMGLQSFLITRDGTIYSANRYDHRRPSVVLLRRDPRGRVTSVARFTAIDGMREADDGTIVVVDGADLRTVSRDGRVSTIAQALTRKRFGEDLLGLSAIRDGRVHVADHAGRRVVRVTLATGAAEEVFRSGFLWAPAGVEVAPDALYILEHLRPPLSLLGDLQLAPYLRVRRVAHGAAPVTLGVVWGRQTWKAALALLLVIAIPIALRMRRRRHVH